MDTVARDAPATVGRQGGDAEGGEAGMAAGAANEADTGHHRRHDMIDKLTPEQMARFPEFIEKWTRIGLSTEPADRLKAEHGIRLAYEAANLPLPRKIVWCGSPLSQGLTRAVLLNAKQDTGRLVRASMWASVRASVRDSVGASVRDSVWASVGASVGDSVGDSMWDSVGASVWASVGDSVGDSMWDSVGASVWAPVGDSVWDSVGASMWDSVGASVRASVRDSVWASVGDSVWASVRDSVRDSVGDSMWDSGYGQHDAHWIGFYDYFRLVLALTKQTDKLQGLTAVTESAGWFLPHQHICWISERHRRVCRNTRGQLHSEDGPAVEYPDGFAIWALNGVRVPEELVMTPAEHMDPRLLLKDHNAEVRRERVRKIGIERVCAVLTTKVLDKKGDYELLNLDMGDGRERPYLKMRNPSIGVYHIEGVAPHIKTVQQAINWRSGDEQTDWQPEVLT